MISAFKELELEVTKYFTIIITVQAKLLSRYFASIRHPLPKLYCLISTVILLWTQGGGENGRKRGRNTIKVKNFCTSTTYGY